MTTRHADFSVIIPTLNRSAQLQVCMHALASQDYGLDRFEVVVVDDGSEIPVAPLVSEFASILDIKVARIPNGGPAAARNHGAEIAHGRFLAFTDDDCIPSPGWISALMTALQANPEALVGGAIQNALVNNPFSVASQLILDFCYHYFNGHPESLRFFSSNNMALCAALFKELGGFDLHFRTSEDRDLCDRWKESGRQFVYASKALVRHSNNLKLRSFWRQHLGYGRGAYRFYRSHRSRHPGESTIQRSFYGAVLLRLPFLIMQQRRHRLMLPLLMVLWQAANLAGFLQEASSQISNAGGGRS
jgi:glycosyltransferase involved in cell wall biosynthesis